MVFTCYQIKLAHTRRRASHLQEANVVLIDSLDFQHGPAVHQ